MDNLLRSKYVEKGIVAYISDNARSLFIGAVIGIVISVFTTAPISSYHTRMLYADRECAIQSLSKHNVSVSWDHSTNLGLVKKYGINESEECIWVTHDELMKMAREYELTNTIKLTN